MNRSDMLDDQNMVRPSIPSTDAKAAIPSELISAVQLAVLLGISERTLYRLKSNGHLPKPILLGGSVRWRVDEIQAWIADGCPMPFSWAQERGSA